MLLKISGNCLRIVRTKPGSGTGDTVYQTNDGRWWLSGPSVVRTSTNDTMPAEVRYKHGGHLCGHK